VQCIDGRCPGWSGRRNICRRWRSR
jgi:hypothetical protein